MLVRDSHAGTASLCTNPGAQSTEAIRVNPEVVTAIAVSYPECIKWHVSLGLGTSKQAQDIGRAEKGSD